MRQDNPMNDVYEALLKVYTPLDIKDITTNGASRKAKHHRATRDIIEFYGEYNEGIHHNLLDCNRLVCANYLRMQASYNDTNKTDKDQFEFIRDVVWLYIDAVADELADQYDLRKKSREEIKDEMLAIDLEHRKRQLHIIDGGKK